MFAHWSVTREKVYSYKKLLTIWEAISNTRHSFLFRYADTSKTFLIESAAPPPLPFFFFFFVCDDWASGSSCSKAEYHYPPDKSLSIGQVLEKTNCAFQWIALSSFWATGARWNTPCRTWSYYSKYFCYIPTFFPRSEVKMSTGKRYGWITIACCVPTHYRPCHGFRRHLDE